MVEENVLEALQKEIDRCSDIKKNAEEIGIAGQFLVRTITHDINESKAALVSDDVVKQIRCLATLREYKE